MQFSFKQISFVAPMVLVAASALASPVINSTGISGASGSITFSEVSLTPGASITNQYTAFGSSFSPNLYFRPQDGYYATDSVGNFGSSGFSNPFVIAFTNIVDGAAFDFITNPGTSLFEALLNNAVVESFRAKTGLSVGTYYGFDGVRFDSIRVTAGGNNGLMEMDNLQFRNAAVPEPGTLALAGLALAGLAYGHRRKA